MKVMMILFLCLLVSPELNFTQENELFDNLELGAYDIGLRIIDTKDETRIFPTTNSEQENSRPVKMYVWYPAKAMYSSCRLSLKCYLKFMAADLRIKAETNEQIIDALRKNFDLFKNLELKNLDSLYQKESKAILDALPLDGAFPVVVVGEGNRYGSAINNFILCEYLASNGFVVVSYPSVGTNSLKPENSLEDIETQVQDLNFILSEVTTFPNANDEKIALVGFDMCGFASFLLQMRNTKIDALACLSNQSTYDHSIQLLKKVPGFGAETLFVPMLHFMNDELNYSSTGSKEEFSIIQTSDKVDRYLVRLNKFPNSAYTSFCMLGIIEEGYNPSEIKSDYKNICEYTLGFLNSYLKDDEKAKEYLMSEINKTESLSGNIRIEYLPGKEM